ncbi:hypothetical protein QBC39DRAFT_300943 [Podospora conica]|nr:hypothetical protein QBC39DRAFT_300943 [Schizothecium conicum]
MALTVADEDRFFVYENRLSSFQGAQPLGGNRRASNASTRAPKGRRWPHKWLSPVELAKAGFFWEPYDSSPDNVVCFLCNKSLDGWEEDDDPLEEHLKHMPECGWAIMAAIEANISDYGKIHPLDPNLVEARKATFAGRWPYESKKGFKCKTQQLAEAGWKYTPTLESDDTVSCAYCPLALGGWESGDKPIDEHYKRTPDCPFFVLKSQLPPPKKPRAKKTARASKASRLSVQSVATVATDHQSLADITSTHDDSVMTTASTMTQGGKKTTRAKKSTAAKPRKTRAKKEDAVEILEDDPEPIPEPPAKPVRSRKRASDAVEDSVMTNAEAPPAKKRAARGKKAAVEPPAPSVSSQDLEMEDAPVKPARKGRASTAKTMAKRSQTSLRAQALEAEKAAEDEEIDRQLQADLDRPLTDDEDLAADSDAERRKAPVPTKGRAKKAATTRKLSSQSQKAPSKAYAMLDPNPAAPNEADIEADLVALQAEAQADEAPEPEALVVPKKGRKAAAPRKVSKQTKKAKQPQPASDPVEEAEEDDAPAAAPAQIAEPKAKPIMVEQTQDPDASSQTLKRGRGRPPKRATTSQGAPDQEPRRSSGVPVQVEVDTESNRPRESFTAPKEAASTAKITRKPVAAAAPPPIQAGSDVPVSAQSNIASSQVASPRVGRVDKSLPPAPQSATRLPRPPTTPRKNTVPSASAKQATISPSQSPQSSDAENQAPSSRAAASAAPKRVVLAPVAATPTRGSPSKRHAVGGLQSTTPWTAVDIDLVFSPDKENGVEKLLRKGGELTTPEKNMTVEEWIYHNAGLAEQKLKEECEAMVSGFEKEGTRAMRVLEGLIVD